MPDSPDADRLRHDALKEELEAARRKRDSYQALLKDLPEVFEGKFRERIRPHQQRNDQLHEEGMALREQIRRALPPGGGSGHGSLPVAAGTGPSHDRGGDQQAIPAAPERLAGAARPRRGAMGLPSIGLVGALAAGLALGLGPLLQASHPWYSREQSRPSPRPSAASLSKPRGQGAPSHLSAATPDPALAGVPSVRVRTTDSSWVEVRSRDGVLLFSGDLNGQRSFPLRGGLMIRSGRADLVHLQVTGAPERLLGPIDWLDWTTLGPDGATEASPGDQP